MKTSPGPGSKAVLGVVLLLALGGNLFLAPPPPPFEPPVTGLQAPPPSAMLRVASLGRPQAAADVLWLRLVSFIGSDTSEANGYLGIETFLDRITDLAPNFSLPYWMGGILLATSPGRSEAADQILAKGERKYPDDWEFSQWRGFVAYFGEMDIPKALQHYKNAVAKPGHAPYLRSFIKRLEASQTDCFAMSNSMSELVAEKQSASTRDLLVSRAGKIIKNCVTMTLKQAAASYRLQRGQIAYDVQTLVAQGFLAKMPPAPNGYCWAIIKRTELLPCDEVAAEITEIKKEAGVP